MPGIGSYGEISAEASCIAPRGGKGWSRVIDWDSIRKAYLDIKSGKGKRFDLYLATATVKVYAAGTIIRIDIKQK
jgi:hypothetical protein